jgi:NAD(P)-dependent dehydrogenase (short-subunit alcohol dehydrogenase family)
VRSQPQVQQFVEAVRQKWGVIDVLVNNAGIIQAGPYDCMTLEDYQAAMETHFWGPLYMIAAALPYMRWPGSGRIVNVASIGGEISVPHLLPYCASKFALVGLSEGLRSELLRKGIKVTTVCPGLMRTGSPRNALFKGQHRKEYAWFSISGSLPLMSINSRRAARQIARAAQRGRPYLAISLPAKAGIRLSGLFPNMTSHLLGLFARCLPTSGGVGTQNKLGKQSFSRWSPSLLTGLTERAARRNNELRR